MNIQLSQHMYNLKDVTERLKRHSQDRPDDYGSSIYFTRKLIATATNLAQTLEALEKAREYGG